MEALATSVESKLRPTCLEVDSMLMCRLNAAGYVWQLQVVKSEVRSYSAQTTGQPTSGGMHNGNLGRVGMHQGRRIPCSHSPPVLPVVQSVVCCAGAISQYKAYMVHARTVHSSVWSDVVCILFNQRTARSHDHQAQRPAPD